MKQSCPAPAVKIERMTPSILRDKARLLLARRGTDIGMGFYVRQSAVRHVLFSGMFLGLMALAWWADMPAVAYILSLIHI